MTKLTDMQAILLVSAAQRDSGRLLPIPETLAGNAERARMAIQQLIRRGLAVEAETSEASVVFREDGDNRFTVIISDAGKQAIGTEMSSAHDKPDPASAPNLVRAGSKQAKVLQLLCRDQGATIAELRDATGWLPHTTRAALTGFRKRGTQIKKTKVDGVTRYKAAVAQ